MRNWIVAASVTDAAREIIEQQGGSVEILCKEEHVNGQRVKPRLHLVTIVNALYRGMHKEDGYFSYVLSRVDAGQTGTGAGICYWDDDPIATTIYHWNGTHPADPHLVSGLDEESQKTHPWR